MLEYNQNVHKIRMKKKKSILKRKFTYTQNVTRINLNIQILPICFSVAVTFTLNLWLLKKRYKNKQQVYNAAYWFTKPHRHFINTGFQSFRIYSDGVFNHSKRKIFNPKFPHKKNNNWMLICLWWTWWKENFKAKN